MVVAMFKLYNSSYKMRKVLAFVVPEQAKFYLPEYTQVRHQLTYNQQENLKCAHTADIIPELGNLKNLQFIMMHMVVKSEELIILIMAIRKITLTLTTIIEHMGLEQVLDKTMARSPEYSKANR